MRYLICGLLLFAGCGTDTPDTTAPTPPKVEVSEKTDPLKEFEKAILVANQVMLRTNEVLATKDDAKIREFTIQIVNTRERLLKQAEGLVLAGHDEKEIMRIAKKFDSSPIPPLTEYLRKSNREKNEDEEAK